MSGIGSETENRCVARFRPVIGGLGRDLPDVSLSAADRCRRKKVEGSSSNIDSKVDYDNSIVAC
jgi:hypothetical protein